MNGVIADAAADFGAFAIGSSARTPVEILSHVADVLSFAVDQLSPGSFSFEQGLGDWPEQARRYRAALYSLDCALSKQSISESSAHRLMQGPLADVLTHVGQLAMLRGLAGRPVPSQVFFSLSLPNVSPESADAG
jgi:hypothetical protein